MPNPGLNFHDPIKPISTVSGNQPLFAKDTMEAAGQTWQPGSVVQMATAGLPDGFVIASTPSNGTTQLIALGITAYKGRNYATNGQGASPVFGSIGFPGGAGAVQDVPNQPQAFSIYQGAPFVDGLAYVYQSTRDTIFRVQVDASAGTVFNYNATLIPVGSQIALAIDPNGWWYADLSHIGSGAFGDVIIVGFDSLDLVPGSTTVQQNFGHIYVVFTQATAQQFPI